MNGSSTSVPREADSDQLDELGELIFCWAGRVLKPTVAILFSLLIGAQIALALR